MHCQIVKRGWLSCGPSRFGSDLKTEEKLDRSQAGWRTAKAWPVDTNHMNPLAQAKPYTEELFSVVQQEMSGAFFFRLWLVAGYKIVNDIYLLWKKKPALFRLVISYQSFFFIISTSFFHIHLPLTVCLLSDAVCWQTAFCLHYARGLSDKPRGVTMFVVKWYKSGPLRGTRGELTRMRPWRPSADKALLIQMDRTSSAGDLSMCQLPTSQPQITSTGQNLGDLWDIQRIGGTA